MADEPADAGLRRFLALGVGQTKVSMASGRKPPMQRTQRQLECGAAAATSVRRLITELELAHNRIYAPQLGIGTTRRWNNGH